MEMIFGCPQYYVQGPGVLSSCAKYICALGIKKKVLIIIDNGVLSCVEPMFKSLDNDGIQYKTIVYKDQITLDKINNLIKSIEDTDFEAVFGVGGGKAIDVAKRVSWDLKMKMIAIPTSIATDAATSRTAVAYGEKNEIVEDKTLFNPDGVIVDSSIIINAPVELFRAGMADALSKRYEYLLSLKCGAKNWYDADSAFFIDSISKEMHLFLLREGRYLHDCFYNHKLNETVERAITAMLLMSRIVWDAGGLHGAHDMFEEFHDAGYGNDCLHGEIVGYFDIVQMMLENYPENEIEELYKLYEELHIPLKISQMGFPVHDKNALDELTSRLINKCSKFGYYPSAQRIKETILALEEKKSNKGV